MFTGIVEETGRIVEIQREDDGRRFVLEAETVFEDGERGDSICVNGACLTFEEVSDRRAVVFVANETVDRTWFDELEEGDEVNLERALTPTDRMGGHFVQGHVEASAEILAIERDGQEWNLTIEKPSELANYIVEKGFIAIDGISLTITENAEDSFSVMIIPETMTVTNLSEKAVGDEVNLETDVLAKYVEQQVS